MYGSPQPGVLNAWVAQGGGSWGVEIMGLWRQPGVLHAWIAPGVGVLGLGKGLDPIITWIFLWEGEGSATPPPLNYEAGTKLLPGSLDGVICRPVLLSTYPSSLREPLKLASNLQVRPEFPSQGILLCSCAG